MKFKRITGGSLGSAGKEKTPFMQVTNKMEFREWGIAVARRLGLGESAPLPEGAFESWSKGYSVSDGILEIKRIARERAETQAKEMRESMATRVNDLPFSTEALSTILNQPRKRRTTGGTNHAWLVKGTELLDQASQGDEEAQRVIDRMKKLFEISA